MKRGLASFRVTLPLLLLAASLASAQPPDPPTAASHRQGSADAHHPAPPRANSEELGRLTEAVAHSLPSAATRPITINNYIDEFIFAKVRRDRIPHAELCSDSEFLRRVSLDLTGRLPEPEKIREFVRDANPKKREKLVDALMVTSTKGVTAKPSTPFLDRWTYFLDRKSVG